MSTINLDNVLIEKTHLHIVEELTNQAKEQLGAKAKITISAEIMTCFSLKLYAGSKEQPKACTRTISKCYWTERKTA